MADPAITQEVTIAKVEVEKLAAIKPIHSDEDVENARLQIKEINRVQKNIIEKRNSFLRPQRLAIKETTQLFQEPIEALKKASAEIKAKIAAHSNK